ncbi:MAG: hypothetical protein WD490_05750 [Opitutales bacterium]
MQADRVQAIEVYDWFAGPFLSLLSFFAAIPTAEFWVKTKPRRINL